MAITFRGRAEKLNSIVGTQNSQAHNMKSAAGHRDDVGGEDVSLKQAMSSFSKRNSSPAKSNCSPITSKAKSSPFKINQTLVDGAKNTNKQFLDVGPIVGEALNEGKTADLRQKAKTIDTPKSRKINTNLRTTNPLDDMEASILKF
tara:strand:- start:4157 stop:4594 length:438 start_codon:yes stop_codon:yes gene_type:complete